MARVRQMSTPATAAVVPGHSKMVSAQAATPLLCSGGTCVPLVVNWFKKLIWQTATAKEREYMVRLAR